MLIPLRVFVWWFREGPGLTFSFFKTKEILSFRQKISDDPEWTNQDKVLASTYMRPYYRENKFSLCIIYKFSPPCGVCRSSVPLVYPIKLTNATTKTIEVDNLGTARK